MAETEFYKWPPPTAFGTQLNTSVEKITKRQINCYFYWNAQLYLEVGLWRNHLGLSNCFNNDTWGQKTRGWVQSSLYSLYHNEIVVLSDGHFGWLCIKHDFCSQWHMCFVLIGFCTPLTYVLYSLTNYEL